MRALFRTVFLLSLTSTVAACGGAKSESKEPASEPAGAAGAGASSAAPSSGETASSGGEKTGAAAPAAETKTEEKPFKSAKDVITSPDVLFVFNFSASEAYQKAEEKCEKKANGDAQKKSECMSKTSSQFDPDGIHFKQDDAGKWWWLTEHRKGTSGLETIHKIEVEFADEKDYSVTIKPKGRDMGKKPMTAPKEVVIEVPSPSQISINDPKNGKMVYEAKVGLLGEATKK